MAQNFKIQNVPAEIVSKIEFLDFGVYLFFGSYDLDFIKT